MQNLTEIHRRELNTALLIIANLVQAERLGFEALSINYMKAAINDIFTQQIERSRDGLLDWLGGLPVSDVAKRAERMAIACLPDE